MTELSKKFYKLPVYFQRKKILKALKKHQVIILESDTGSGKTTHIPGILYKQGYSSKKKIAITQPRRIAAISVTEFVRDRLKESYSLPADYIGYKIRFKDETTANTKIKIMTDGTLLQEMRTDPLLSEYSIIVIDEAHERSLNIDFVLGLCKNILAQRSDLKLLISSATINTAIFTSFFSSAALIRIDVPKNPITIEYRPAPDVSSIARVNTDLANQNRTNANRRNSNRASSARQQRQTQKDLETHHLVGTIKEALKKHDKDMIVFLPGEGDIKDCVQALENQQIPNIQIFPLYGRLSQVEQQRVFDVLPSGIRKIVVSTNIAETSITIDGVGVIIDSGKMKLNSYQQSTLSSKLEEVRVSKSSAIQRAGRSGRTGPGTCYRLYTEQEYKDFPDFAKEEILRTNLSEVILRMAFLDITNFGEFPYISQPTSMAIKNAVQELQHLGALDSKNLITDSGRIMSLFPVSPNHARIIFHAMRTHSEIIRHVLIVISFLTSQSPFLLPINEEMNARRAHRQFAYNGDDMLTYILIFENYLCIPLSQRQSFCEYHYLDLQSMVEIVNVFEQLKELAEEQGVFVSSQEIELPMHNSIQTLEKAPWYHHLRACICIGLPYFVCKYVNGYHYLNIKGEKVYIHPGSMLSERKYSPLYIVAGEIVATSKCFARSVTPITQQIIEDVLPNTLSKFNNREAYSKGHETARTAEPPNDIVIGTTRYPLVAGRRGTKPYLSLEWDAISTLNSEITKTQLKTHGAVPCKVNHKKQLVFSRLKLETLLLCERFYGSHPQWVERVSIDRHTLEYLHKATNQDRRDDINEVVDDQKALPSLASISKILDTIQNLYSPSSGTSDRQSRSNKTKGRQIKTTPNGKEKGYTKFLAFKYNPKSQYAQLLVQEHLVEALNISAHSLDLFGDTIEQYTLSLASKSDQGDDGLNEMLKQLNKKISKLYHKIIFTLSDHKSA